MSAYNSYTTYPVLWNRRFPSHWEVLPMYAVAQEKSICDCVGLPLLSVYLDVGVIPFSAKAEKRTNVTSKDLSKYQRVDCGDFVLNNQQARRGSVGVSFNTGIVSPAYIVLSMNDKLDSKYANYLLRSRIMVDQYLINSKSVGSIQRNIYWLLLKRTSVIVPPRPEQDQIVRFLDWKVSAINRLINIKRKEIRAIDAMKRSLVCNAVTHGLDPTVPIKYSGVRWLGDIPAHWKVTRVKSFVKMKSGKNITSEQLKDAGEYPVYGGNGFRGYYSAFNHNGSYILVGRQGALAGNVHKVNGKFWATEHALVVIFINDIDFNFFYYLLIGMNLNQYAFDTAAQPGLTANKILNLGIPIPPSDEQIAIVGHIKAVIPQYEAAIEKLSSEIRTLEECKACLISDVVTGKIDVRDIEVPEYEFVEEDTDGESVKPVEGETNEE